MKGIKTNIVSFSTEKSFLIDFINIIFQRNNKSDSMIASKITDMIKVLVTKPPLDYKPQSRKLEVNEIEFIIPDNKEFDNTVYFYISKSNQKLIENFVYNKFLTLFDISMSSLKGMEYKVAIENFMDIYNVPVDKYEMLKKRNYRERSLIQEKQKKISRIINTDLSSFVPFSINC